MVLLMVTFPRNYLDGFRSFPLARRAAKSALIGDAVIRPIRKVRIAGRSYCPAAAAPRVRGSGAPSNPFSVTAIELAEVWPSGSTTV